jgi:hypothetical protein
MNPSERGKGASVWVIQARDDMAMEKKQGFITSRADAMPRVAEHKQGGGGLALAPTRKGNNEWTDEWVGQTD